MIRTSLVAIFVFLTSIAGGIIGAALAPTAVGAVQQLSSVTNCTSTSACVTGSNTSTGPGVQGTSVRGAGVRGTSSKNVGVLASGVTGIQAQSTGTSAAPGAAVLASSSSASNYLFVGQYPKGTRIFSVDSFGILTAGILEANKGVFANDGGVFGFNSSAAGAGVLGNGGFAGVYASNAVNAPNSAAFYAEGHGGKLYVAKGSAGGPVFEVDDAGNVIAHSFTAGFAAAQTSAGGARVMTYATESRSAIIEDFGEARLVAAAAYVRIDPSFTALMLHGTSYAVFITPLAPVHGMLYVSQKQPGGFTVREIYPEHLSIAFDYRIVARRYVPPAPRNLDLSLPKPPPHLHRVLTTPPPR